MFRLIVTYAWYASAACQAIALWTLAQRGLLRRYPWLSAWLVFSFASTVLLAVVQHSPGIYYTVWTSMLVVIGFLECGMTWEVFSLRCRQYGGVRFVGRRMLVILLLASLSICLFLLRAELQAGSLSDYVSVATTTKHVLDGELSGFLILTECLFSMVWKPSVPRNVLFYGRVFTAYMFCDSLLYLFNNLLKGVYGASTNLALSIVSAAFATAVLFGLTRAGEKFESGPGQSGTRVESVEAETGALMRFLRDLRSNSLRQH